VFKHRDKHHRHLIEDNRLLFESDGSLVEFCLFVLLISAQTRQDDLAQRAVIRHPPVLLAIVALLLLQAHRLVHFGHVALKSLSQSLA